MFHFTDVPVLDPEQYAGGKKGRSDHDIVHMITYCIDVLRGDIKKDNERKITKGVAVILLAHYLGDIHQPLHVGAEYFDAAGNLVNPDKGGKFFSDEGGNTLNLILQGANGHAQAAGGLHGYWDSQTVITALSQTTETKLVQTLAANAPVNWQAPQGNPDDWAESWANEILPIARHAHQRLIFEHIHIAAIHGTQKATGDAEEQTVAGQESYQHWAGAVVKDEIQKGGWRLAALLEQLVH